MRRVVVTPFTEAKVSALLSYFSPSPVRAAHHPPPPQPSLSASPARLFLITLPTPTWAAHQRSVRDETPPPRLFFSFFFFFSV